MQMCMTSGACPQVADDNGSPVPDRRLFGSNSLYMVGGALLHR